MALFSIGDSVKPAWTNLEYLGIGRIFYVADDGIETPRYIVEWTNMPGEANHCQHIETELIANA